MPCIHLRADLSRGMVLPVRVTGWIRDAWTFATIDPSSPDNLISEALATRIGAIPLGRVPYMRFGSPMKELAVSQVTLTLRLGGCGHPWQSFPLRRLQVLQCPLMKGKVGIRIGTVTLSRLSLTAIGDMYTVCI